MQSHYRALVHRAVKTSFRQGLSPGPPLGSLRRSPRVADTLVGWGGASRGGVLPPEQIYSPWRRTTMSIPLSSIMAMFSFTKVENWRTVNFLPKSPDCTKLSLKFQNFPGGDNPGPPCLGRGTPLPQTPHPFGASHLDSWPSVTRSSPTPPDTVSYSP